MSTPFFEFDKIRTYLDKIDEACDYSLPDYIVILDNVEQIRVVLKGMESDFINPYDEDPRE